MVGRFVVVARRQGPDTVRMVLGVGRVGVDLALLLEHEAGGGGQADHVVLGQVAAVLDLVHGLAGGGAVFDHAEHAARAQGLEEGLEHRRFAAVVHPVVHVAEGQHHVGRARLAQHRRVRVDLDQGGVAVDVRPRRQLLAQLGVGVGVVVAGALVGGLGRVVEHAHVAALVLGQRRQDLGVPAAAGGDFDDGLPGLHAEERKGFARMTIAIAGDVGGITPAAGDRGIECVGRLRRCRRAGVGSGTGGRCAACKGEGDATGKQCGVGAKHGDVPDGKDDKGSAARPALAVKREARHSGRASWATRRRLAQPASVASASLSVALGRIAADSLAKSGW